MAKDKFSAVWVSHTSLKDFLTCPRAYYLKNVYKNPQTGHKFQVMTPALALGQIVHEVLEALSQKPTDQRFLQSPLQTYEQAWQKVSGKKGGFFSELEEQKYKERGRAMIERVLKVKGPLARLAVKIQQDLPYFWLSEEENIILCGKIDWLEYLPDTDSVHIIDFKTGKKMEDGESLQLPIYHLLVHHCQHRQVSAASYWYLEFSDELEPKQLPDLQTAKEEVLRLAKQVKLARQLQLFKCKKGADGCSACQPLEKIVRGEGELVGENEYHQDIYILPRKDSDTPTSAIL